MRHCFSIDIEEWFDGLSQGRDHGFERRLEKQVNILLDLLGQYDTRATFFWLASRAREYPALVRTVASLGHEIACHGFHHRPIYQMQPAEFRNEAGDAKLILQDIIKDKIAGFRAPYFSITNRSLWAIDILAELEYTYDSSIYPTRHWRYGIPNYPSEIQTISTPSGNIFEVPLAVRKIAGYPVPLTGGAYFRLYPYALTRSNISSSAARGKSIVFNIHPWELDADHPRIKSTLRERLPHYYSLGSTIPKLYKLFSDFSFITIGQMLENTAVLRNTL
jgi:polysaccharide deacetylase family protein (PEP-CTERM system associated)